MLTNSDAYIVCDNKCVVFVVAPSIYFYGDACYLEMFHGWEFQGNETSNIFMEQHFKVKGSLYIGVDPIYKREMRKTTLGFSFRTYVPTLVARVEFILNQIHAKSENVGYMHVSNGGKGSASPQTLAI